MSRINILRCVSERHLEFPQSWTTDSPILFSAVPSDARLEWIETHFLPEPQEPGPKPILERAGLLLVGNLGAQDLEQHLSSVGQTIQSDGHWGVPGETERIHLWEQEEGVLVTLNPDQHPGRPL